jgi:amidase/aspartyl-tRNA(Asn)/glutamyl-tRNA(Gln) amidotransferase subunit A
MIILLNVEGVEGLKALGVDLLGEHRDELPPQYVRWLEHGYGMSALDALADQRLRTEVYDMVQGALTSHDLLVTPTLACLPVENAPVAGDTVGPSEVAGVAVDELPVGLQVIGRRYADADVLAASAALERVRPWQDAYRLCEERPLTA